MSYAVEVGPQAIEDLAALPTAVQRAVLQAMRMMAAAPTRLSRPALPPYPPGMLYRADVPAQGVTCLLDIVFRYGQDEQTLHVERVFVEYA
jgi:hypothetical protein